MKRFHILKALLAAFIMTVATCGTAFAGSQDFTLVNGTGKNITAIYLSPTDEKVWIQQDELGKDVLRPGESLFMSFDAKNNVRFWDIKVGYEGGGEDFWIGLDLYKIYQIIIRPQGGASIEMV